MSCSSHEASSPTDSERSWTQPWLSVLRPYGLGTIEVQDGRGSSVRKGVRADMGATASARERWVCNQPAYDGIMLVLVLWGKLYQHTALMYSRFLSFNSKRSTCSNHISMSTCIGL